MKSVKTILLLAFKIEPFALPPFPCLAEMAMCHTLALRVWDTTVYVNIFTSFLMILGHPIQQSFATVVVYLLAINELCIKKPIAFHSLQNLFNVKILAEHTNMLVAHKQDSFSSLRIVSILF